MLTPFDPLTQKPSLQKKASPFLWLLAISVALNVAVLSYVFVQWQDGVLWLEVESLEPKETPAFVLQSDSLGEMIAKLSAKSDDELISSLSDETVVANGYRIQELSLALLRQRGFLVEDPLRPSGAWPQKTTPFCCQDQDKKPLTVFLFSSVTPQEALSVLKFFQETSVPYTAEGIVRRLSTTPDPTAIKAALFRTDEWVLFRSLFQNLSEEDLCSLAQEIGPEAFSATVEWSRARKDGDDPGRFFLFLFRKYPSSRLADLLASKYADTVILQAPDEVVLLLYSYLLPQSEHGARLAIRMLQGQRKPHVWRACQAYLAKASGSQSIISMNRDQLLVFFRQAILPKAGEASVTALPIQQPTLPQSMSPAQRQVQPIKPASPSVPTRVATRQLQPYRTYVVKKGDTLWSVAKKFGVDVEKLKYLNGLRGTVLSPGKTLKIPH